MKTAVLAALMMLASPSHAVKKEYYSNVSTTPSAQNLTYESFVYLEPTSVKREMDHQKLHCYTLMSEEERSLCNKVETFCPLTVCSEKPIKKEDFDDVWTVVKDITEDREVSMWNKTLEHIFSGTVKYLVEHTKYGFNTIIIHDIKQKEK